MQLGSIEKPDSSQPSKGCSTRRIATAQANRTRHCRMGMGGKSVARDRAVAHRGERSLKVRFEDGLMASARPDSLEHLNPDLGGSGRPCPAIARQLVYSDFRKTQGLALRDLC